MGLTYGSILKHKSVEVSVTPTAAAKQVPLLATLVLSETVDKVVALAVRKLMISRIEMTYTLKIYFI